MTDASIQPRPDPSPGFRWLVLLSVSMAMFGNYYVFDAMNPVGPMLEKIAGFSGEQVGFLDTAYNIAALIVLLIGGVIIDRAGTKKAMILFGIIAAAGGGLIAISTTPHVMMAGRFVLGLGAEPLIVAATVVLGRWCKGKELGFAMAMNLTIARLGSTAADNSPRWASGLFSSWQPPLYLAAGVGLLCIVGGVIYALLERRAERTFTLNRAGGTDKLVFGDLVSFSAAFWFVVGLCVTFYSAIFPFRRFANAIFENAHGLSPENAGSLNGGLPLAAMIATPIFGILVDKIGRRGLLMAVGSLLLIPSFLMLAYAPVPPVVSIVLLGISFSLVPAVMWPAVTYLVDEKKLGSAYAMMTFCQQIGWAVVAWGAGKFNDVFNAGAASAGKDPTGYVPSLWLFASLGIMGLVFSLLLLASERGKARGLEAVTPGSNGAAAA